MREKLSHNRSTSVLYKPDVFTKNVERVYQVVYERYLQGLKPAHIAHNAGSISENDQKHEYLWIEACL